MAGVACAVLPLPLTITLLLGLLGGQTDLLPVIAIGAITGFHSVKGTHSTTSKTGQAISGSNNDKSSQSSR